MFLIIRPVPVPLEVPSVGSHFPRLQAPTDMAAHGPTTAATGDSSKGTIARTINRQSIGNI